MPDQGFAPNTQGRVELAFGLDRQQPLGDARRLAPYACQPAGERCQCADQQQDLQASAASRQVVLEALAVTVGFEVAERQFDLHPARVEADELSRARCRQGWRTDDQPWLALTSGRLATGRAARDLFRTPFVAVLAALSGLGVHDETTGEWIATVALHHRQFARRSAGQHMQLP